MEWQPIETAPDGGGYILVWHPRQGGVQFVHSDGDWWRRRIAEGSKGQPTHWMPLPEPPK